MMSREKVKLIAAIYLSTTYLSSVCLSIYPSIQEEGEIDCCNQPDFKLGPDWAGQSEMWFDYWMEEGKASGKAWLMPTS